MILFFLLKKIPNISNFFVLDCTNRPFRAGDKSSVQRGFYKNSAGDLLPFLSFLGGLMIFNFGNYVFFNVGHNDIFSQLYVFFNVGLQFMSSVSSMFSSIYLNFVIMFASM